MALEIERKFLVKPYSTSIIDVFGIQHSGVIPIWQGYFAKGEKCSVRLRIEGRDEDQSASLTFKSTNPGMTRQEIEFKGIHVGSPDLENLKAMCEHSLSKTRYLYQTYNQHSLGWNTWEIDVFHDELDGLVLAEIELPEEGYEFEIPPWLGDEVTHIGDYYNYSLAKNKTWPGKLTYKE